MSEANNAKPSLFIGSSTESLDIAYALQENLERNAEVTVWTQGVFELSKTSLQSLMKVVDNFDFAAFIFTPDDCLKLRGEHYTSVRDNVVFELGLFSGAIGEDRTFIVMPQKASDLRFPTDLIGLTPATYDASRGDGNLAAALGPTSTKIKKAMNEAGLKDTNNGNTDTVPAAVATGLSDELRIQVQVLLREQESKIEALFNRLEGRIDSLQKVQQSSAKAPILRLNTTINETLSVEAKSVIKELSNGGHLTSEQYDKLITGEMRKPLEELRKHGLLSPLSGKSRDGSAILVYWIPPPISNRIVSIAKQMPDIEIDIATNTRLTLASVGYSGKRDRGPIPL